MKYFQGMKLQKMNSKQVANHAFTLNQTEQIYAHESTCAQAHVYIYMYIYYIF